EHDFESPKQLESYLDLYLQRLSNFVVFSVNTITFIIMPCSFGKVNTIYEFFDYFRLDFIEFSLP
ncbi:hypothetical protein, partial [Priestia megaterium]|uniref:hypothetical protein n=1 Tax=Priestia megaterium TaxID=1404 RepID=UPI002FFF7268